MFDWITGMVEQTGYFGIALLMFGENVFPPIPSELIMPLAGYTAASGDINIVLAIVAGTVGSVAGALLWYYAGRWIGCDRLKDLAARHGRWFTVTPKDLDDAYDWFRRHCGKAVLIGRLVPAVRTLISVPAGIVQMGLPKFLLYTTLGSAVWTSVLAGAGYLLGSQYEQVGSYLNPVSNIVIGGLLLWYAYRVATFRPKQRSEA
jgi:membrane protein DedA with SNARE-associated domain